MMTLREVRTMHPFGFRSGQWAKIVDEGERLDGRRTWLVYFPDGVSDTWVADDELAMYEIRECTELTGWQEAALTLDVALDTFLTAKTPQEAAYALVRVNDARSDLRTWLPGWDYETGTLPWEREGY